MPCLHTPDTVFELPKLSRPRYYDDQVQSQRRPIREAACEIILEENVQLAEYFTRLLHKQILKYPVVALPMQILQASVEAFKAAIEDNVVPHQFLDQVFTYFNYLYFDKIDTRTDKEFGEKLLYSIDTCRANSRELHFIMDSCPAQVLLQPLFSSNSNCSCSTLVINQSPFRCNGSRNLRQLSGTSFSMSFFSTTGSSMVPSMTLFLKLHSN